MAKHPEQLPSEPKPDNSLPVPPPVATQLPAEDGPVERRDLPEIPADDIVREDKGSTDKAGVELLMDACDIFNINPSKSARPRELAAWRYFAGQDDGVDIFPASVVLVTFGGLKIKMWAEGEGDARFDEATLQRLSMTFGGGALPDDLALPVGAIDGQVRDSGHVYKGGYLKSGGKTEADKRANLAERRARANRRKK